jgi:peptidoglycan/LPS O-acetylase OafA/YrhL
VAVDLFFILSGCLIAQSFSSSHGVADYFRKRVLRIFPAFVVAGVLSLVLFGPLPMGFARAYWVSLEIPTFTFRLLTLQTLWIPQSFKTNHWPFVNSAIWTIQYEFVCYVLIAALGIAGFLHRRVLMLGLFVIAWVGNIMHHQYLYPLLARFPRNALFTYAEWPVGGSPAYYPRFFTYFLAGSIFYVFRDRITLTLPRALLAAGALFLALFIYPLYDVAMPIAGTYLAFWFAFNPEIRLHRFGKHGDFSYGLYVYGWPVQQTVIWLSAGRVAPLTLFLSSLTVALGLAVGSWHVVEQPFLRLKARGRSKLRPLTAAALREA